MKTEQEMMAYFKQMAKKPEKENPYWIFDDQRNIVCHREVGSTKPPAFHPQQVSRLLYDIQRYFRSVYESFQTEAQVLCVTAEDGAALRDLQLPRLDTSFTLNGRELVVLVLPQVNTWGNSSISESFWQNHIVGRDITPVMRVHSHHVLSPYQSATDYSTLNSNTLELVLGNILDDHLRLAYWLDKHGTQAKNHVHQAMETTDGNFDIQKIVCGCPKQSEQTKNRK